MDFKYWNSDIKPVRILQSVVNNLNSSREFQA